MRLLYVSSGYSTNPNKGYLVMLKNHLDVLSADYQVDLISFGDKSLVRSDKTIQKCKNVTFIKLSKWKIILNFISALFSKKPFQVSLYRSREMQEAVELALKKNDYDLVVFQLIRTAQFLPNCYKGASLLNMIDPVSCGYEDMLPTLCWAKRIIYSIEASRLKEYENAEISRFSHVSLISSRDVAMGLSRYGSSKIRRIRYGVDVDYFKQSVSIKRRPGMIVISGNMGYAPNVKGVLDFCKNVFPLVLTKQPKAELWIVGVRPSSEIIKLKKMPNIHVTGYVPDIRIPLAEAMVCVCPIQTKVGLQTKVLEAMASGTPVVTTEAGNLGVGASGGVDLVVAKTPDDMANAIINLLCGIEWTKYAKNGLEFVQNNYMWKKSVVDLESILTK